MTTFTVNEVLTKGWEITKKYWLQYIGLVAIIVGYSILFSGVSGISESGAWQLLMFLINLSAQIIFTMATIRLALNAVDGKQIVYKDLFKFDAMQAVYVLGVMILFSIVVGLGLLLFIIPGIILALMFSFAIYFVVEKNMSPIEAMGKSKEITEGNRTNIFLFWLALFGLNIAIVAVPGALIYLIGTLAGDVAVPAVIILVILFLIPMFVVAVALSMISSFGFGYMYRKLSQGRA